MISKKSRKVIAAVLIGATICASGTFAYFNSVADLGKTIDSNDQSNVLNITNGKVKISGRINGQVSAATNIWSYDVARLSTARSVAAQGLFTELNGKTEAEILALAKVDGNYVDINLSPDIKGLSSDSAEVTTANSALQTRRNDISAQTTAKENAEKEIAENAAKITKLTAEIAAIDLKLNDTGTGLNKQKTDKQAALDALAPSDPKNADKISQLNDDIDKIDTEITRLTTKKTAAETAKTAAESAKTAAETAKTNAETALSNYTSGATGIAKTSDLEAALATALDNADATKPRTEKASVGDKVVSKISYARPGDAFVLGDAADGEANKGLEIVNESNLTTKIGIKSKAYDDSEALEQIKALNDAGWKVYMKVNVIDSTGSVVTVGAPNTNKWEDYTEVLGDEALDNTFQVGNLTPGQSLQIKMRVELPLLTTNEYQELTNGGSGAGVSGFDITKLFDVVATQENNPGWNQNGTSTNPIK